ncbi:hypothetical protein SAMN06297144_2816 [Sphingomonas guangdongensis]|uniref:Copper uptake system-associated protein n=1 Tax=Sphingomonas guangdongensis TaxID=1141890 RepID=A0A285R0P1_9SPHN|nr:copper uptake system-associated protein [Sphingomonas guangdongensis]SOB87680.1 hypothetical protein SAMN06297144_2816 [Sphingomonas guangdongensis]
MVLALLLAGCGISNPVVDDAKVREATELHFGSPLLPIDVGPVVLSGDHAIADWTQGDYGGRALFERNGAGWILLLCSGDSVRRAANLERAGVPPFNAAAMADQLVKEERDLPPERLARLKRFVGTAADHQRYLRRLAAEAAQRSGVSSP